MSFTDEQIKKSIKGYSKSSGGLNKPDLIKLLQDSYNISVYRKTKVKQLRDLLSKFYVPPKEEKSSKPVKIPRRQNKRRRKTILLAPSRSPRRSRSPRSPRRSRSPRSPRRSRSPRRKAPSTSSPLEFKMSPQRESRSLSPSRRSIIRGPSPVEGDVKGRGRRESQFSQDLSKVVIEIKLEPVVIKYVNSKVSVKVNFNMLPIIVQQTIKGRIDIGYRNLVEKSLGGFDLLTYDYDQETNIITVTIRNRGFYGDTKEDIRNYITDNYELSDADWLKDENYIIEPKEFDQSDGLELMYNLKSIKFEL